MKSDEALKHVEVGIDELIKALEQGRSDTLIQFLEFQARFYHYSFRNCLLIAMQKPTARIVAGFARWKQLGRYVKKGEKGLMILAPLVYRQKKDVDNDDEQSSPIVRGFRVAHVFDVAQTEGAELPEFSRIHGQPGEKLRRLQRYVSDLEIALEFADSLGGAHGASHGGKIEILNGLEPAEEFLVTAHELAHELLHRGERRKETTRKVRELEAEAVAFIVCRTAGLDAVSHSADYIQLYSGDRELLMQSLDHIQRVSMQIISVVASTDIDEPDMNCVRSVVLAIA
ncbi:ArdC family protein [Lacipirellula parvula]|uniref:N-terminal domain-containing protein n=1 Tax=Lacipirellula parvula TaxID=2650471 RepID=A0A5K7XMJ3_9BACT|nr:ArdC-like ssDNA-binding domain-containing protein [Lacipirellula parvula]BBO34279.1 hypothetical protein PLANPX_3891 [Lacipirellula parvula]